MQQKTVFSCPRTITFNHVIHWLMQPQGCVLLGNLSYNTYLSFILLCHTSCHSLCVCVCVQLTCFFISCGAFFWDILLGVHINYLVT